MSRHHPYMALGWAVLITLVVVLPFAAQKLYSAHRASPLSEPVVVADDPVAIVKSILVNGVEQDEVPTSELKVSRAATPDQGGQGGMQLILGDEVTTGPDAKVTLLFLDGAPERDNEVLLESNSRIRIGSVYDLSGKILVRQKGQLQTLTQKMRLDATDTAEYEVLVQSDGTNRLRVIDGSVNTATGNFARSTHPADPDPFTEVAAYNNAVEFAHASAGQRLLDVQIGQPGTTLRKLEQMVVAPGGALLRTSATTDEVDETLNWSNNVIIASQPSYTAQSIIPRWQTAAPRDQSFRNARRAAVLNNNPRAYGVLGQVYVDWGNGAKAIDQLTRSIAAAPSAQDLTSLGEAYRLVGNLPQAEAVLLRTVTQYPTYAAGFNALGNVYKDRAKVSQDRKNYTSAIDDLRNAKTQFERARTFDVAGVIVQANLGESDLALGDIAREQGRNNDALAQYRLAEQSFAQAERAYPAYSFSTKGLGDVYRGIANAAAADRNVTLSRDAFARSQQKYNDAIRNHRDLAEAYVGLGNLYEDAGRKAEATRLYQIATQVRPESRLAHYHYALALSDTNRRLAASHAAIYQRLERGIFKQGEKFRRAQIVIDNFRFGRRDPVVTPTPTPTPVNGTPTPTPTPTPFGGTPTPTPTPIGQPPPSGVFVKVPGVNGNRPDEALKKLQERGLVGVIRQQSDCKVTGKVLSTDPKKDERVQGGSTVTVLVSSAGENAVTVPSLKNHSLNEVERLLRNLGLQPKIRSKTETNSVDENTVLRQNPDPNTRLPSGCPVELTISVRIPLVQVPDFIGSTRDQVFQRLNRYFGELLRGDVTEVESERQSGIVLDQSPKPGEMVPRGTRINLVISRSQPIDNSVAVPDFRGRSLDYVKAVIERTRGTLRMGNISYKSDNAAPNTVIAQSPQPFQRVPLGTAVNVVIATSPIRIN
jgi:beta-lactam-binding protein with PASTA domain/tetratricopeptide (TPR) repeat protein